MIDYELLLKAELEGLYGETVLTDMNQIITLYDFYEGSGQNWTVPDDLDYTPTKKITNLTKKLIKEEARFMFSRTPEILIKPLHKKDEKGTLETQQLINKVLKQSRFANKIIRAGRDCFIGKRVAIKLSANIDKKEIKVMFRPSLEFIFEPAEDDIDVLNKITFFYQTVDSNDKTEQRIWKQTYQMLNGKCILNEGVYDGFGQPIEIRYEDYDTGLDFIPAYVIINDGLTGDLNGESDIIELIDNAVHYNKLTSDDIDALRFNMFPMKAVTDATEDTLKNIKIAPNALVDLQTSLDAAEGAKANMQNVEATFNYNDRLENTLNRLKNDMYELLNIPNVSLEQLKGLMQSGKSMKALYWGLISRCEEKWATWKPALEWMVESIIKIAKVYNIEKLPEIDYTVEIVPLYPIMEDEEQERQIDMQEVETNVRSRKSYIEKWGINEDADAELQQIAEEQDMLDNLRAMGIKAELNTTE